MLRARPCLVYRSCAAPSLPPFPSHTHCLPLQPKGGAFTGDEKDFYCFKLGSPDVIPAFNEAVAGMKVWGWARLVWWWWPEAAARASGGGCGGAGVGWGRARVGPVVQVPGIH